MEKIKLKCSKCGMINDNDAKYCIQCGALLKNKICKTNITKKGRILKILISLVVILVLVLTGINYIRNMSIPKGSINYESIMDHVANVNGGWCDIEILQNQLLHSEYADEQSIYIMKNENTNRYVFPININDKVRYCYVIKVITNMYSNGSYDYTYYVVSLKKINKKYYSNIIKPLKIEKNQNMEESSRFTTKELEGFMDNE